MIRVRLREAMEVHRLRTGERLTYALLAERSGVGEGTLSSIGSRLSYNVTLETVEKLSRALNVPFHDLLEQIDDPPKPKRTSKKKGQKQG
jgi:transcriptional regulator with XRE-family HTH domain